jgi:hypothetical protein
MDYWTKNYVEINCKYHTIEETTLGTYTHPTEKTVAQSVDIFEKATTSLLAGENLRRQTVDKIDETPNADAPNPRYS